MDEEDKTYPSFYDIIRRKTHSRNNRQADLDAEFSEIDSSNWKENYEKIAEANKPKSELAQKGRELRDINARMKSAGLLNEMMSNPAGAAYDTLNKMEGVQICDQCGHKNPMDAKVCENCGARLDGKGKIGGALSNFFEKTKHTVTGGEAEEGMSFKHRMQQISGMGKRRQRKKKTNEDAMEAGNMGFFADMMGDAAGSAEKARTRALKICPECGYENDSDATHCEMCGARLDGRGKVGGFFADKAAMAKGKIKSKTTDKVRGKIDNTKSSLQNKVMGAKIDAQVAGAGLFGDLFEGIGNSDLYTKSTEVAERMANGESFKDIAMDHLTSEGEGPGGLFGEKGGLNKIGGAGSKIGNFLQAQGGKAGKIGNIVSKGSNILSGAGKKGAGGLLKGGLSKLGKTGIGKAVTGTIGKKLATKGVAQVASKVLAGGLMATGIGAPLAAIMASPIGGFLVEGAMNLGGKALGAIGGAVGGIGKALFGRKHVRDRSGRGGLGGLMAATPMGMLAGAAGGLLGSVFGGGGPRNMGSMGAKALGMVAAPLGGVVGMLGKMFHNDKLTKGLNEKMEAHAGKTLEAIRAQNSKTTTNNSSGGNITIQNININTQDDPEAIKAMFLELIIELQEQVSPRLVSRTAGEKPSVSTDTSTDETTEDEVTDAAQESAENAADALSKTTNK